MALADHLRDPVLRPPHKMCGVCWVRETYTGDEADVFDLMLADHSTYTAEVVRQAILDEYGITIGIDAVQRHRRPHHQPTAS